MKKKKNKKGRPCYLDFDDFGEKNNRLDWLWMFHSQFPNFKVNLFTVPTQFQDEFAKYIKGLDWIQVCVHGYEHKNHEELVDDIFTRPEVLKDFAKVYRAPFWQLSDVMYEKLKKYGYKIMLHPDDPRVGIKYNWNVKDSPPPFPIIYGHGHVQDTQGNGIVEAFENIMKLPEDTKFQFL